MNFKLGLEESEEEAPKSLEEKVKLLQEEKLPKEKIVEQIFEEDMNANVTTLSTLLDMSKLDIGRIKGRLSRLQKLRERAEKGEKEEPPTPYKTEIDVNSILEDILKRHPDVTEKVKEEIMDWAKLKGGLQPMEIQALLQSMRGITATTAGIIASKYSFAVNKALQEGKLQLPPVLAPLQTQSTQVPPWSFQPPSQQTPLPLTGPAPQQQFTQLPTSSFAPPQQYPPQLGYPPQTLTPQDVRNIFREEMRGKEPRETEQFVEIEEPVKNDQGEVIIDPQDRPIMKRMRVPVSQAGQFAPREDAEERVLHKLKAYRDLFGPKEELTEDKIRKIVREETPPPSSTPPEKAVTLEEVKQASSEAAETAVKTVLEAHEKEDVSERRHQELLRTVREGASTRAVEGYKDDSFRIMGQGMSEVGRALAERKPVEVLIREGGPLILGTPPGKEVEAGAGEGIINRLKKRGWVVAQ